MKYAYLGGACLFAICVAAPACMASTRIANAPDLIVNEAEAFLAHRAGRRSNAPVAAGAVLSP